MMQFTAIVAEQMQDLKSAYNKKEMIVSAILCQKLKL